MSTLLPGTQVEARGLPWEVVHSEPAGEQHRFRLRCLQGDLHGMEVDILHPFEPLRPIATDFDPARAGRLRQWRLYHDAFLLEQALGPSALLAVQPGRLDIAPYQLVPVMRALRMSRPRLLLADGVGLGKTIEAGLIMAELIARRRAHRILIVSPAGPLLEQWHREMRERFGLRFDAIRSAGELQEVRRSLVLGANPFDHVSYCLTSVDFAKQEKVLQELERTVWDLVVIDEAHHCVRLGEVLAFVALLKRSVSTVSACRNTLRVIRDRYRELVATRETETETRRQRLRTLREYQRRLERYGALSFEEEQDRAALEAEDMAAELAATGLEAIADRIDELRRAQRLGPLFDGLAPAPEKPAAAPRPAPRPTPASDDGAYDAIARLLDTRGLISSGDAQQATGLDAAGVRSHLKRLVDEGRAVTEGQRRGMKYRRADG